MYIYTYTRMYSCMFSHSFRSSWGFGRGRLVPGTGLELMDGKMENESSDFRTSLPSRNKSICRETNFQKLEALEKHSNIIRL